MSDVRRRNAQLASLITDAGLSHAQVARAVVRVATEIDARELMRVGRSHVSHWIAGSKPAGIAPTALCEALSRLVGRVVTPEEVGLGGLAQAGDPLDWETDTLVALAEVGRLTLDVDRRRILGAAAYSLAALALPDPTWWLGAIQRGTGRSTSTSRIVRPSDVDTVQDMISMFSAVDQRRGGGHARAAVVQYLTSDVAGFLQGRFPDDQTQRQMFSAASELSYLSGWMAFDDADHATAQHFFAIAVKLAAEADDPPMAGHVLRAMAHQAIDLGHFRQGLALAEASVEGKRSALATPRERALLGVVHAKALAVNGEKAKAAKILLKAETDLRAAELGDADPPRVFFFGEASLAHEAACVLRDSGDLIGAEAAFQTSVRRRKATAFARTHAVTLGYLGTIQARLGSLEAACASWNGALDAMSGVRSGRTRQAARDIRSVLAPFHRRGLRSLAEIDCRAKEYLSSTE